MAPRAGGDFNVTGVKSSVPGGTTNAPGKLTIASRIVPSACKVILERWSAKVVDVGNADQIYFAIMKNGVPVQAGLERIPAIQFDYQAQIELNVLLTPGFVEIVAFNISGMSTTIEPDALAVATAVNCQAWWTGSLVSER